MAESRRDMNPSDEALRVTRYPPSATGHDFSRKGQIWLPHLPVLPSPFNQMETVSRGEALP